MGETGHGLGDCLSPWQAPHRTLACWPASFAWGATGFISDHVGVGVGTPGLAAGLQLIKKPMLCNQLTRDSQRLHA
jgi:hypothetical protein